MMKKILLDDRPETAGKMRQMSPPSPFRMAAAAAALTLAAFGSFEAQALGLGRITVLSALGEPLRAEIEVSQITAEEAASLKTSIPPPATFSAAGVEFNPALVGAAITLQQRPDGRSYLRLTSDKIINEPFLDLILEAQWGSGRLIRDYTLLFDPPRTRAPAPLAAGSPQVAPAPARTVAPTREPPAFRTARLPPPVAAAPPPRRSSPPAERAAAPEKGAESGSGGKTVTVKPGDTAGRIAAANKPSEISLDQMLVALLRTNPDAFISGNINRIKAGAVVEIPTADQAGSVPSAEARKILSVQSANFNEFRRKLADAAPAQPVAAADRQATGLVQPSVEEKKSTASSPDKLTLSKGSVKGAAPEAQIATARQGQAASERVAELSKNISDLSRLQDKTAPAGSSAPASAARTPAVAVGAVASSPKPSAPASTPAVAAATTAALAPASAAKTGTATATTTAAVASAASAPASAAKPTVAASAASSALASATATSAPTTPTTALTASPTMSASSGSPTATVAAAAASSAAASSAASAPASGPVATASAAVASVPASAAKPKPAAVAPPPPEPSLVDELLENPVLPAAAAALLALLGGFAFYRSRQRKKASQVDSSFLESKLQPDSFFGSSGGQRIDTADEAPTGSSLAYSPSQLDAAGDVDPVAEADVYLAYGRDLQAEEILKEALKMNPTRIAIHGKLLEILAKRRDARAFEVLAGDAFKLSAGEGAEWERICEFGRELDPENALYQPGGQPKNKDELASFAAPAAPVFASSTIPVEPHADFAPSSMPVDLDLGDLDFSSEGPASGSMPAPAGTAPRDNVNSAPVPLDVELSWDDLAAPAPIEPNPALQASAPVVTPPPAPLAPALAAAAAPDSGMIEFDLGSLSLDLDRSVPADDSASVPAQTPGNDADPLETKLALAQEFRSIGDSDGARALVEEVVVSATGPLKAKAQRFLAELD
jgi:pilus assembly protein FimV